MSSPISTDPAPGELAPSEVRAAAPSLSRMIGFTGLFAFTAGFVSVIASWYGRGLLGEGMGYLLAVLGLTGLFAHSASDSDPEVRRAYGAFAAVLLVVALVMSVIPGPFKDGVEKSVSYYLLPWGAFAALMALAFAIPFTRHETEEPYGTLGRSALLGVGGILAAGSAFAGICWPDTLLGPGVVVALLGAGFLAAYLATVDTSEGTGYWAVVGIGTLGAATIVYALGRSIAPATLYDGPGGLKNLRQEYDFWKVAIRLVLIVGGLGVALAGVRGKRMLPGVRLALVAFGLAISALFLVGSVTRVLYVAPSPYLVPSGLLLTAVGLLFLGLAVGVLSDNPLVVLTRRELAAYFYSPIAYIVLVVMALSAGIGYWLFLGILREGSSLEPILQDYLPGTFIGPLLVPFLVPALTMRLFSEEKRTGTLEVLLTAPVSELSIVLSKFLACWAFYMLCWVPAGLFLIGLRVEGGSPFDYRPLLSFYLAVAASGAAFVAMGLFFSSLTTNQIVAAVLTFVVMLFLMVTRWNQFFPSLGPGVKVALTRLSYWLLWTQSLRGQLPVRDVVIQGSIAVFWMFLTVRVLEARKWR